MNELHMLESYTDNTHNALWDYTMVLIREKITHLRNDKDKAVKIAFFGK